MNYVQCFATNRKVVVYSHAFNCNETSPISANYYKSADYKKRNTDSSRTLI